MTPACRFDTAPDATNSATIASNGIAMDDKRLTGWTDERVQRLKQLYESGLSASRIAAELGEFVGSRDGGRNAVIGKLHRLGLTGRKPVATANEPRVRPAAKKRKKAHDQIKQINFARRADASVSPEPFIVHSADVETANIPFSALNDSVCKFECSGAHDTSEFAFCGRPPKDGKPFCDEHCRIAYAGLPTRRNRINPYELSKGRGGVFGRGLEVA